MRCLYAVLMVCIWMTPVITLAQDSTDAEVDHVALAARLVSDGHYDRARSVIAEVDPQTDTLDLIDYHTVKGLVALHDRDWQGAIGHLDQAIFAGKTDDTIFVYLAQAHYGLQNYEVTVRMVDNAGEAGAEIPSLHLMKAQSLWKLGRLHQTWNVLTHASRAFPAQPQFDRLLVFLLVELGLFQEAGGVARTFLDSAAGVSAEDYIAFGQALISNGELDQALTLLEKAALMWPEDRRVTMQLAGAWAEDRKPLAAAELLQRASDTDESLIAESAEMYRRAGSLQRALYMNAQIDDQEKKFRQRVAILTDDQQFEAVAAMESRLQRLNLLEDQSVLYAVAYARFQTGDYEGTERLLKRITNPSLFESATKLRQVMAYCSKNSC